MLEALVTYRSKLALAHIGSLGGTTIRPECVASSFTGPVAVAMATIFRHFRTVNKSVKVCILSHHQIHHRLPQKFADRTHELIS